MSRRRGAGFKEATCQGKVAFATYEDAGRLGVHSERLKKKGVHPYKCPHCRLFHVGAAKPGPNKRVMLERIRERECME